jgi:hypothetical protein
MPKETKTPVGKFSIAGCSLCSVIGDIDLPDIDNITVVQFSPKTGANKSFLA